MHIINLSVSDLSMHIHPCLFTYLFIWPCYFFNRNVISQSFNNVTDLPSFSNHLTCINVPLTINRKLRFRYASIQLTTDELSQVPALHFCECVCVCTYL